jgi:hypothetical protein
VNVNIRRAAHSFDLLDSSMQFELFIFKNRLSIAAASGGVDCTNV